MEYEKFANMLLARIRFPFQIEEVFHIDCADTGTTFIELRNKEVYVLRVNKLEQVEAETDNLNPTGKQ